MGEGQSINVRNDTDTETTISITDETGRNNFSLPPASDKTVDIKGGHLTVKAVWNSTGIYQESLMKGTFDKNHSKYVISRPDADLGILVESFK